MKDRKSVLKFILLTFFLVLTLVSVFVAFLVATFTFFRTNNDTGNTEEFVYRLYRYNEQTKDSSEGITTLSEKLEVGESMWYENEDGDHFLISDFETNRYRCYGTCSCVPNNIERRRSIEMNNYTLIMYSVIFLTSAATSFVALRMAIQHFGNKCDEDLKDTCDGTVESEVSGCDEITDSKKNKKREFMCSGSCVHFTVPTILTIEGMYTKEDQAFAEYLRRFADDQDVDCGKIMTKQRYSPVELEDDWIMRAINVENIPRFVADMFMERDLDLFCKRESFYLAEQIFGESNTQKLELVGRTFELCTGFNYEDPAGKGRYSKHNPKVECIEITDDSQTSNEVESF